MLSRASRIASRTACCTSLPSPGGSLISMLGPSGAALAAEAGAATDDADEAEADAAWRAPLAEGATRTPSSSMVISMLTDLSPPLGASALDFSTRARGSRTVSVMRQLNGGSDCRIAEATINSTASTAKRFQLMLTSQLA